MLLEEKKINEMVYMSKFAGTSEEFVQAGGGNTSVKLDDRYMVIKSSGYQLSEVEKEKGFSIVDYRKIVEWLEQGEDGKDDVLQEAVVEGRKPSIETFLHSITENYTIHTHPLGVTVMTASQAGMEELRKMFPGAVFVEYATPGIVLAKKYFEAAKKAKENRIVFLKNHGLIVCADSMNEAIEQTKHIILKVNHYLKRDTKTLEKNICLFESVNKLDSQMIVYDVTNESVKKAIKQANGIWEHRFTPDCIVYCGGKFFRVEKKEKIDAELAEYELLYDIPKVIIWGEDVFVAAVNTGKAQEIGKVLEFTAKVYLDSERNKLEVLSKEEVSFLLGWDSEKYRSRLEK